MKDTGYKIRYCRRPFTGSLAFRLAKEKCRSHIVSKEWKDNDGSKDDQSEGHDDDNASRDRPRVMGIGCGRTVQQDSNQESNPGAACSISPKDGQGDGWFEEPRFACGGSPALSIQQSPFLHQVQSSFQTTGL